MNKVCKDFTFHAAHKLPHHMGDCKNLHGHTYKLRVCVAGLLHPSGSSQGMVVDFGDLKRLVTSHVLNRLDHKDLNKLFENPTAEIMVRWVADELDRVLSSKMPNIKLMEVRLWETAESFAVWESA